MKIADFRRRICRIFLKRLFDFVRLFANFAQHGARIVPVEADPARLGLQLERAGQRGQGDRHAGERALAGRLARRGLFAFLLFLLCFDVFPKALDGLRVVRAAFAEHVRVPADEFGGDRLDDVAKIERVLLLRHAGVKYDLQQQVAKFFFKIGQIASRNGVGDLVRFFERVGCNRCEILFEIPRAAGLGRPQRRHDLKEPADVAGRDHARSRYCCVTLPDIVIASEAGNPVMRWGL